MSLIIRSAVTCGVPLIKLYLPFKPKYPFTAEGIGATKDNNEKLKSSSEKLPLAEPKSPIKVALKGRISLGFMIFSLLVQTLPDALASNFKSDSLGPLNLTSALTFPLRS